MNASTEMPSYQSHKQVSALQIKSKIGNVLTFMGERFAPMDCDPKMFARYEPVEGDYLVVYRDGYKSISPKKEFEDGYTLVGPELGATGKYPMPALDDADEGELRFAVGYDAVNGLVRVEFGKPVAWLALPKENAVALAKSLLTHCGAKAIEVTL